MGEPMLWPDKRPENRHEAKVWDALRDQLGPNDLIIANQRFVTPQRGFELDLAVVLDGLGVVVLEVKGGQVWHEHGRWLQSTADGEKRIDPFGQAERVMYTLRDWVENSPSWGSRRRITWAHAAVFTDTEVDLQFTSPEASRWQIVDQRELSDIAGKLRTLVQVHTSGLRTPDGTDTLAIHEALQARFAPQRDAARVIEQRIADRDQLVERLSAEQARILDALQLLDRVEVRGGAGTGKTWLAVEQARRLAASGKRVALLAYSRGLASWMNRRFSSGDFEASETPAYIGTFHGLGAEWGALQNARDDDPDFWEDELPRLMVDLANEQSLSELYDAIIIDEAQDFADLWWPAIHAALKYDDSPLYVFSDEGQRVFQRFGDIPGGLVPLLLDRNLRNTRQISSTFTSMASNRLRESEWDGPEVRFIPCSLGEVLPTADDAIDSLLVEGWQPADVALLTTGSRHDEQKSRVEHHGRDGYWESFWDDDQVFYSTVLGFKGLERPAVVLAVNESTNLDRDRERLYVGLSRARDLLVVCGDPDYIRRVGGPEVLEALEG